MAVVYSELLQLQTMQADIVRWANHLSSSIQNYKIFNSTFICTDRNLFLELYILVYYISSKCGNKYEAGSVWDMVPFILQVGRLKYEPNQYELTSG